MKVTFYPVKTTAAKLIKLTEVATEHFRNKDPLLFLVPDAASWEFLDKILWSLPSESFLPHPSRLIQIQTTLDPTFATVFNVCPTPVLQETIQAIYELEDHTSPEKLKASQDRYRAYRSKDLHIIVDI